MSADFCAQNPLSVSFADVEAAANRLQGTAFKTPVLTSETFNKRTNSQVFFKCENFQRTGSFKFRGACNALMQLSEAEKQRGVLTFSSGNHAQAIALAARLAEIIWYDRTQVSREELATKIGAERHLIIIPPYDHAWVIAGQGTAALELLA